MLPPKNIQAFFDNLRGFIEKDENVPREIREEITKAKEVSVQSGTGFMFVLYVTANDIPKKFQYYSNGMALVTSGKF